MLVIVGAAAYIVLHKDKKSETKPTPSTNQASDQINYSPPTQQEKKDTEEFKKSQQDNLNNSTQQSNSASVVITYAGQQGTQITVNSFVGGTVEDGGTCTAEFTKGTQKVTKTSEGFANVSNTNCAPIFIDRSEYSSSGDWDLKVSYKSAKINAVSDSKKVTIQ